VAGPATSVSGVDLAPVPRLDPAQLLAQLREHCGTDLELLGPLPGGQVGAALVAGPDGRRGVLTQAGDGSPEAWERVQRTVGLLAMARERGVPAPDYRLVLRLPDRIAVVQEYLPGVPPARVEVPLVEQMIRLTEASAGLLASRPDVPAVPLYLLRSGPGFCLHGSLAQYDGRTRVLLDVVRRIGAEHPTALAGGDLVHTDFHPGNVLVDRADAITGVVDWDGVGRGDRRFDLVTLRFDMALPGTDQRERSARQAAARWLDARLDDVLDPALLRLYWAHMSLRLVDWAIRHHGPDDVDRWLTVAAARLA
jgi:aminoglycoside phosphotransferase (APT) family kinase protein